MKKAILILFLAITLSGCGWLKGGDKSQKNKPVLQVYSNVQERTRNGVLIASKNGTVSELKDVVDASLDDLFADASYLGYTNTLNFSDYIIYVLDNCTPSPGQGVPSFRLRADEYDGTIFDQDSRPGIGYILASEYVIKEGSTPTTEYVICNDLANAANNVRYGAEHIILSRNNQAEYQRTEYHGNGVYHPIMLRRNSLRPEPETQREVTDASGEATGRVGQK